MYSTLLASHFKIIFIKPTLFIVFYKYIASSNTKKVNINIKGEHKKEAYYVFKNIMIIILIDVLIFVQSYNFCGIDINIFSIIKLHVFICVQVTFYD